MPVSPEFLIAYNRMREIGEELIQIKHELLRSTLNGLDVKEVVIEQTIATLKIRRVRILLKNGNELLLQPNGVDYLEILPNPPDQRIVTLEMEWKVLNKKWHIYP